LDACFQSQCVIHLLSERIVLWWAGPFLEKLYKVSNCPTDSACRFLVGETQRDSFRGRVITGHVRERGILRDAALVIPAIQIYPPPVIWRIEYLDISIDAFRCRRMLGIRVGPYGQYWDRLFVHSAIAKGRLNVNYWRRGFDFDFGKRAIKTAARRIVVSQGVVDVFDRFFDGRF
jgi:hypothetical protein